jgi:hypothetical protein
MVALALKLKLKIGRRKEREWHTYLSNRVLNSEETCETDKVYEKEPSKICIIDPLIYFLYFITFFSNKKIYCYLEKK